MPMFFLRICNMSELVLVVIFEIAEQYPNKWLKEK